MVYICADSILMLVDNTYIYIYIYGDTTYILTIYSLYVKGLAFLK